MFADETLQWFGTNGIYLYFIYLFLPFLDSGVFVIQLSGLFKQHHVNLLENKSYRHTEFLVNMHAFIFIICLF